MSSEKPYFLAYKTLWISVFGESAIGDKEKAFETAINSYKLRGSDASKMIPDDNPFRLKLRKFAQAFVQHSRENATLIAKLITNDEMLESKALMENFIIDSVISGREDRILAVVHYFQPADKQNSTFVKIGYEPLPDKPKASLYEEANERIKKCMKFLSDYLESSSV